MLSTDSIEGATWTEPTQYTAGIDYVLTNGQVVVEPAGVTRARGRSRVNEAPERVDRVHCVNAVALTA